MKAIEKIKAKVAITLQQGRADDTFLTYLFSNIRIALEKKNEKNKYRHLSMYCNWYQHAEISHANSGHEILQKIGKVFYNEMTPDVDKGDDRNEKLIRAISDTFNLPSLQEEMLEFFGDNGIDSRLILNGNWDRIIPFLLNDLESRPLILPINGEISPKKKDARAKAIYQQLVEQAQKVDQARWDTLVPFSVAIEKSQNGAFSWVVVMQDQNLIVKGPFTK